MAGFGKLDWACIVFMIIVILISAAYWALFAGWSWINSIPVWIGWLWWIVVGTILIAGIIVVWTSRRSTS